MIRLVALLSTAFTGLELTRRLDASLAPAAPS